MERNSRVKHAHAWAVQGCLGIVVEKNSGVKRAQAWAM